MSVHKKCLKEANSLHHCGETFARAKISKSKKCSKKLQGLSLTCPNMHVLDCVELIILIFNITAIICSESYILGKLVLITDQIKNSDVVEAHQVDTFLTVATELEEGWGDESRYCP